MSLHARLNKLETAYAPQIQNYGFALTAGKYDLAVMENSWERWLPLVAPSTYSAGFEWFHTDLWEWYWPLLQLRRAGLPVPPEMPLDCFLPWGRGLAKSSSMEGIALAEGAMLGEAFGVYISSTKDKAQEHLQAIRMLIESSEIARYYPKFANPRVGKFGNQRGWKADAIYTAGGFAVVSVSLEQGIRGLKDGHRRPTFILLDDIDERDDSLEVKREKFEAITQDALPMLAPYGITIKGQNLIYSGSIADDTLQGKADWFHHCHIVGVRDGVKWRPVNTYQDDLQIEKRNGRPTIMAGTPNWSRLDTQASQRLLDKIGERAFWRECQNRIAPDPEELVWKTFQPALSVITWEQFAAVFGTPRIRADFNLAAGYDRGATGPDRHPATFSVAAIAPQRSALANDIFIFYEYVANATEDVGEMARHLIEDLALLCDHPEIKEAASLVRKSFYHGTSEVEAWKLRQRAGSLIKFQVFNGSHEGLSERRTLRTQWGLPVKAGKAGKTEGLEQLHHYAKPEAQPHPFNPQLFGRPNLWLVVHADQYEAATDRWGLQRTRWEAANLKWDKNVTTRDVPMKFGDDITDAIKHYMQTLALTGAPLTLEEQVDAELPEAWRVASAPQQADPWARDGWEMGQSYMRSKIKKQIEQKYQSQSDPWNPVAHSTGEGDFCGASLMGDVKWED